MSRPDNRNDVQHVHIDSTESQSRLNHWQDVLQRGGAMLYVKLQNYQKALSSQSIGQVVIADLNNLSSKNNEGLNG